MKKILMLVVGLISFLNCYSIGDKKSHRNLANNTPIYFTVNNGQVMDLDGKKRTDILFTASKQGVQLFITSKSIHYQFVNSKYHKNNENENAIWHMSVELVQSNPNPIVEMLEKQDYVEHFYSPNVSVENVSTCNKILIKDVYPNIDWIIYSIGNNVKYDFRVRSGGDYKNIKLKANDASINILKTGELIFKTPLGKIKEQKPISFCLSQILPTAFYLDEKGHIGFKVKNWQHGELIIDPSIVWSTYYGGSNNDWGYTCKGDTLGNIYLYGITMSTTGIASAGALQDTLTPPLSKFIVKFDSTGKRLWGTYYSDGNPTPNEYHPPAVDDTGAFYITGRTTATMGIATPGAYQTSNMGGFDAYIIKFSSLGVRIWGTYYGGTGDDVGTNAIVDAMNGVYLVGRTTSNNNIATTGAWQTTYGGNTDAFLVKFNANGIRHWATYYGGGGSDEGITCKSDKCHVYISGSTTSQSSISSPGSFQDTLGNGNSFFAKFNKATGNRVWATYYGYGSSDEFFTTTDDSCNLYVTGTTSVTTGVTSTNAFQTTYGGGNSDAFLLKFNASGIRQWATYLGGGGDDEGKACAVDANGNIILTGTTTSNSGIAHNGLQATIGGGKDVLLAQYDRNGIRKWGTYLGGVGDDYGQSCAVNNKGDILVAGYTNSNANIALPGSFQDTLCGGIDAFLFKIKNCSNVSIVKHKDSLKSLAINARYQWLDCDNNYSKLINDTNAVFVPKQSGAYAVEVTQNGCIDTSDCQRIYLESNIEVYSSISNNTSFPNSNELWSGTTNDTSETIKLCADGSKATKIKFVNTTGIPTNDIDFQLKSWGTTFNTDSLGRFVNKTVNVDTIIVEFEHPKYIDESIGLYRQDWFEIYDINHIDEPIYSIPINIYRAPVLMVHGLWGKNEETEGAFNKMEEEFIKSGLYVKELILRANYRATNSCSFKKNANVVPYHNTKLLTQLINAKFSTGKVDIVAHSMGGLLTRQYIQGSTYNKKNDVHRYISINVPHSGSQVANLALTKDATLLQVVEIAIANYTSALLYPTHSCKLIGDAVNDLKVNSQAMYELNYTTLNNGKTPTHIISSDAQFSTGWSWASAIIIASSLIKVQTANDFLDDLFYQDKHDIVVSVESQRGGIVNPNHYTHFNNFIHMGVKEEPIVIDNIKGLLCKNPNDQNFYSNTWYKPVDLRSKTQYKQIPTVSEVDITQKGFLNITSPNNQSGFDPGVNIPIKYTSTSGITKILMEAVTSNGDLYTIETSQQNGTLNYSLPLDAFGKVAIVLIGYGTNSDYIDYDTISLKINITATLDSMNYYPDTTYIQVLEEAILDITGNFDNGFTHNLSFANGINYTISDTNILSKSSSFTFKGKETGTTIVQVDYLGKSLDVPVVVIPRDTNLPLSINETNKNTHNEYSSNNPLFIYPNPSDGKIIIQFKGNSRENLTIQIYNQIGIKVFECTEKIESKTYKKVIDIGQQSSGIYYINAIQDGEIYNEKVILLK